MTDQKQRFALRKYGVGLASVLIGLTFLWGGAAVHADSTAVTGPAVKTVKVQTTQTPAKAGAQSSTSQASSSAVSSAKSDASQTSSAAASAKTDAGQQGDQAETAAKTAAVKADQSSTQASVSQIKANTSSQAVSTSQKNQVNQASAKTDTQTSTDSAAKIEKSNTNRNQAANRENEQATVSVNQPAQAKAQASQATVRNQAETKAVQASASQNARKIAAAKAKQAFVSLAATNTDSNYNVADWEYTTHHNSAGVNDGISLTKYIGKGTDYYIPNAASFRAAGKITANQKVYATYDFLHALYNGDTGAAEATPNGAATSISVQRAENAADRVVLLGYPDPGESSTTQHANDLFSPDGNNNYDADGYDYRRPLTPNTTLKTLDLAGLDVSQITDMSTMIANDKALTSVTGLDTWQFNPTNYSVGHLFAFDKNLKTVDGLNNWDTSHFRYIDNMFNSDTSLTGNIDLSKWNTQNVILANNMFNHTSALTSVGDLSGWRMPKATDTSCMFQGDPNLTSLGKLDNWGMQSVTNTSHMFSGDDNITSLGDLSKWQLQNDTDASYMFCGNNSLTSLGDLSNWRLPNVISTVSMFADDHKLTNLGNLDNWGMQNVTDTSFMFYNNYHLISLGNLSNWQMQNDTDTSHMFEDDYSLTSLGDLSNWRLPNVIDTSFMFCGDYSLTNLGNLDNWGMGENTNMDSMFAYNYKLTNIGDIGKWDVSNVTSMNELFFDDYSLTTPGDLSKWNVGKVTKMGEMFGTELGGHVKVNGRDYWGGALNSVGDLSKWDVSNVTSMYKMFKGSSLTSIGDLSNWNTNKVTNMSEMFSATRFLASVGNLSKWNQSGLLDDTDCMFQGSGIKQVNVSGWKFASKGKSAQGHDRISGMFTELINPATIIANDWSTDLPLQASDFAGDQPLIVISNNLTALNNENTSKGIGHPANTVTFVDASDQTKGRASQQQNFVFANKEALDAYLANIKTNANLATVNVNVDGTSNKLSNVITDGSDATYLNGKHNATGTAYDGDYGLIAGTYKVTGKTEYLKKDPVKRTFRIIEKLPTGNKTIWTLNTTQYKIATKNDLTGAISDYKYQDVSGCGNDLQNFYEMSGNNFKLGTVIDQPDVTDRTLGTGKYDLAPNGYTINLNESSLPGRDSPIHISYDQAQHTYGVDIYWGGQPMDSFPESQDFYIDYVANPQKVIFKFVDDDKNGIQVGSDIKKTGTTDQTIDTGLALPAGYKLATGQNLPATYKFTANKDQEDVIHLVHATVTVTPDNPKTPADKLPDNPDKNYPTGVAKDDLNKTVTRTIIIKNPHTGMSTQTQTATFTRSATVDEVDGTVTYGQWDKASYEFSAVTVPEVKGYTASGTVDQETVTPDSNNETITISYTADKQTVRVSYMDGNTEVAHEDFNGHTGETTTLTFDKIPANYDVDSKLPDNSYTFTADGNQVVTVKLKHQTENITEHKTITRTITIVAPNGNETTEPQSVTLTRTNVLDKVNNHVTYGTWDTGSFAEYDVPAIAGYTPSQASVAAQDVNSTTPNSTVTITYTANDQKVTFKFVDDDKNGDQVGSDIVKTGKTDQTINPDLTVPGGYKLANNQKLPANYQFTADANQEVVIHLVHATVTVTPDNPKTTANTLPDNPGKNYPSGVAKDDLNKTVTRTIVIDNPHTGKSTQTQTVTFTRSATVDEVDGTVTYGQWDKASDEFAAVTVPEVAGYTASGTVDQETVTPDSNNETITISYTADKQTVRVSYMDGNKEVAYENFNGHTDETTNLKFDKVPVNYDVDGDLPKSSYKFTADGNQVVTINLKHQTENVTERKTIKRTIEVTTPNGEIKIIAVQNANPSRTNVHDKVTDKIIANGDWNKDHFAEFADIPAVPGYTPSQTKVEAQDVDGDAKDSTVNITYTANNQKVTFKFVDDNNNGDQVASIEKTGKTDQTINPDLTVPGGYKLANNQKLPANYQFTADANQEDVIHLVHATVTVTPDNPKTPADKLPDNPDKNYPTGVAKDDLNKTLTRTITINNLDGTKTDGTQKLNFTRTATVDEVNGKVTYGNWIPVKGDSFAEVDAPAVPGYTSNSVAATGALSQDDINNWTDTPANINYTAKKQTVRVSYMDGNKEVAYENFNGHTDETTNLKFDKVPVNYDVDGDLPKSSYKFTADGNQVVTVKLKHQMENITEHKTITRTITIVAPHGNETTKSQPVILTRTNVRDKVNNHVTYGTWDTGSFAEYDVPAIAGYTPSQTKVEAQDVDENTQDSTVNITYTANKQTGVISYVDANGKEVGTTELKGKTDEEVAIKPKAPVGWKIIADQDIPDKVTATATGIPTVKVKVEHATTEVNKPTDPTKPLPDNPNLKYPEISEHDLNKTLTRTIKFELPNGRIVDKTQQLNFKRTATIDEFNDKVTYSDWMPENGDSFAQVDAPVVPGYTPKQASIAEIDFSTQDAINGWTDPNLDIGYTANEQTGKISYIDADGNEVGTTELTGKTDEEVAVTPKAPAGWKISAGQDIPETITATADGIPTVTVKVEHATIEVTKPTDPSKPLPDNPGLNYPSITKEDLNKTLTRTIKFTEPDGTVVDKTQKLDFKRTATIDEANGKVTYSDWTPVNDGNFAKVDAPAVPGYTPSQKSVDATDTLSQDEINNWKDTPVNVTYTADKQSGKISYVDADGNEVGTTTLNGVTDQDVTVSPVAPAGWKIVAGQDIPDKVTATATGIPTVTVKVEHATIEVTKPTDPTKPLPDNPGLNYPSITKEDLNKTLTRTIKFELPNGKVVDKTQTLSFTRKATIDEANGKVTYGDWTPVNGDSFAKVDAPVVPGYAPSQKSVDATSALTQDEINNWKDTPVNITYTADKQTGKISYVDANGDEVGTTVLNGVTDQDVTVSPVAPAGWKIVAGQDIPKTVKATADGIPTVTVKVEHATIDVTDPTDPSKPLPDNPNKNYPAISYDDLNKTLTRTIKIELPNGEVVDKTQTLDFTRKATIDEVNGHVTYGDWIPIDEDGFSQVDVPQISGYIASQDEIPASGSLTQDQINNWTDHDIQITYTKVPGKDNNGQKPNKGNGQKPAEKPGNKGNGKNQNLNVNGNTNDEKGGHQETVSGNHTTADETGASKVQSGRQTPAKTGNQTAVENENGKAKTANVQAKEKANVQAAKTKANSKQLPQTGDASAAALYGAILAVMASLILLGLDLDSKRKRG